MNIPPAPGFPPPAAHGAIGARLSVMMFLQFFVWGAWYVSQTGFMNEKGMGGLISWAYTVGPIAAIVSPFFLGMIADKFFPTQRVLAALHVLGGVVMLLVPQSAATFVDSKTSGAAYLQPYILLLLLHMLCYMPTLGLTTSLALTHMTKPERQFPMIRVWGTIGWIVGNIVVGGNLKTWGLDVEWIASGDKSPMQFYVTGAAGILLGIFSLSLPHTPPPLKGTKSSVRQILGLDALALFAKPSYLVFLIASFLLCIPLAGYYNQARNFVEATGFTNATMTMSYGQMSEIFFMLIMPLCFARLGAKWMLAVGMLAWVVRYGLFAGAWGGAGSDDVKWMVLGGILLHGICYDFFFVTGMVFVEKSAPPHIRGQAQGFLVLLTQGLGMLIGAQAFGWLVNRHTTVSNPDTPLEATVVAWDKIWMAPCIMAAVILVAFVLLFRPTKDAPQEQV